MHGIRGRTEATGLGVVLALEQALSHPDDVKPIGLSKGLAGKRVLVHGLGKVGLHAARAAAERGAVIVGVSVSDGAVYHPDGLDPDAVLAHRQERGSILGFPGARDLPEPAELLEQDCDVLIPAALEHDVTALNASRVRAAVIAEGARVKNLSHISFERMTRRYQELSAHRLVDLLAKQLPEPPAADTLAALTRPPDEIDFVTTALENTMARSYQKVRELWKQRSLPDLRTAAYLLALESVGHAYIESGVFP